MVKGAVLHSRGKRGDEGGLAGGNVNYSDYNYVPSRTDGMKFPTSILKFQKPHPSVAKHRTEKSIECLEWLIKTYTNEGETVLDCTCGSGTTLLACQNTKREYIGIELDPEYYQISFDRLKENEERLKIEGMKRRLF